MPNILDYIDWRGDLRFAEAPFCEVDNLIFSWLAYVDFGGVLSGDGPAQSIPLAEAGRRYAATHDPAEMEDSGCITRTSILLLHRMAQSRRYADVQLWGYVCRRDRDQVEQFAAVCCSCDGGCYVAFRGTDNTLLGWREDFNMGFMPVVPSQKEARRYLECVAAACSVGLWVGGHSKGGNLAVYASVNADPAVQQRIRAVYNNDGPGFLQAMFESEAYRRLQSRIHTIIPQSSVVGVLLEHSRQYTIVASDAVGMMQHDAMSWQVLGGAFVYVQQRTRSSEFLDQTLSGWLAALTPEQRGRFVDTLFTVLDSTGAATFDEMSKMGLSTLAPMLRSLGGIDRQTRKMLGEMVASLFRVWSALLSQQLALARPAATAFPVKKEK